MAAAGVVPGKFVNLTPFVARSGPFQRPGFEPGAEDVMGMVAEDSRVLIVGAGGLGCELLKNFALSGFTDIHVIDMDTIDVSNLNRQFLFRKKDCGESKAEVAAKFIMNRCEGVKITAHNKAIQDFGKAWYRQFNIVVAGLDNIEARRWLNETLIDLVQLDEDGDVDFDTVIPFIDGGTEAFGGQTRVFLPRVTSCFECSLSSMAAPRGVPSCTIRNVPRIPEHCIIYALKVQWPLLEAFNDCKDYKMYVKKHEQDETQPSNVTLDKDDADHMTWLYERSLERANEFGIKGVTYNLTMQVVKNIIPAIASTNALISAACVNEAFKAISWTALSLNNYYMYIGGAQTGTNSETYEYARNPECVVCKPPVLVTVAKAAPLKEMIAKLEKQCDLTEASVSVAATSTLLYMPSMHENYKQNLDMPVEKLLEEGHLLMAADKVGRTQKFSVKFE